MQPQEQQAIYAPTPQPTGETIEAIRKSNKRKLVWGLIGIFGPTLLLFFTVIIFAVINFVTASVVTTTESGEMFSSGGGAGPVVNIIMFLVGGLSTLALLPGLIGGIILLTKRQKI